MCSNRIELAARLGSAPCTVSGGFYATYQVGNATSCVEAGRVVYGCGDVGSPSFSCSPLTLTVGPACTSAPGWTCAIEDESTTLVHHSNGGGVLCCK